MDLKLRLNLRSNFFTQLIVSKILIITETRYDQDIKEQDLGLMGTIFRKDRNSSIRSKGGGELIATKNELLAELINTDQDGVEHLFLKLPYHKIIIAVLYIPPASDVSPYIKHVNIATEIFEKLDDFKFILIGDYNLTGITWSKSSPLQHFSSNKATRSDKDNSAIIKNAYPYMDLFQKIPILASKDYT